jgi:hypothetical protein
MIQLGALVGVQGRIAVHKNQRETTYTLQDLVREPARSRAAADNVGGLPAPSPRPRRAARSTWSIPVESSGVTIIKTISIIADHVEGGVLVSGTNRIVVQAAVTDKILLEGLDIEGLGTGLNGVKITGASRVIIRKLSHPLISLK